jgi:hypothetical protein
MRAGILVCALAVCAAISAGAQAGGAAATQAGTVNGSAAAASAGGKIDVAPVRALIPKLRAAADAADVGRWKLRKDMKDGIVNDLQSIRNDLDVVLPPLLDKAQANPDSVPDALAVYRNVNALYDVMLRVSEAGMYANGMGSEQMSDALVELATARTTLERTTIEVAASQRAALIQLQHAPPPPPVHIVADDASKSASKTSASKTSASKAGAKSKAASKPAAKPKTATTHKSSGTAAKATAPAKAATAAGTAGANAATTKAATVPTTTTHKASGTTAKPSAAQP